jgi:hypothetical protein
VYALVITILLEAIIYMGILVFGMYTFWVLVI